MKQTAKPTIKSAVWKEIISADAQCGETATWWSSQGKMQIGAMATWTLWTAQTNSSSGNGEVESECQLNDFLMCFLTMTVNRRALYTGFVSILVGTELIIRLSRGRKKVMWRRKRRVWRQKEVWDPVSSCAADSSGNIRIRTWSQGLMVSDEEIDLACSDEDDQVQHAKHNPTNHVSCDTPCWSENTLHLHNYYFWSVWVGK